MVAGPDPSPPPQPQPPSGDQLRRGMGTFATGVALVTAYAEGGQHAMIANSFTSLSLAPPLVMVSVARQGRFHRPVLAAGSWAVSVFGADQAGLAAHFSDAGRDRAHQFDRVPHRLSPLTGSALLAGALAWFECRTEQVVAAGDHSVLIGAVLDCRVPGPPRPPLTYYRGRFLPGPLG